MKKIVSKVLVMATVLATIFNLTGCGSSKSETMNTGDLVASEPIEAYDDSYYDEADYALDGMGQTADAMPEDINTSVGNLEYEDKLVYSANLNIETKDFDTTYDALLKLIEKCDGRIESENLDATNMSYQTDKTSKNGYYTTKTDSLVIRIPSKNFSEFMDSDSSLGNVVTKNQNLDNITQNYYNSKTQIELLEGQMEYYKYQLGVVEEQLKTCEDYEYVIGQMIELEDRIIAVQSEINSYTNSIKTMDMQVAYSTVNLYLTEVKEYTDIKNITEEEPDTFLNRLKNTTSDSLSKFAKLMQALLFIFIYILPYILVLGGLTFVIIKICVKISKKRNAKYSVPTNNQCIQNYYKSIENENNNDAKVGNISNNVDNTAGSDTENNDNEKI